MIDAETKRKIEHVLAHVNEETLHILSKMPRHKPSELYAPHSRRLKDVGCVERIRSKVWGPDQYRVTPFGEQVQEALP